MNVVENIYGALAPTIMQKMGGGFVLIIISLILLQEIEYPFPLQLLIKCWEYLQANLTFVFSMDIQVIPK